MEQKTNKEKHGYEAIPVIFFSSENERWEPVDDKSEQSRIAAMYKNQLDAIERAKAANSSGLFESRAMRNSRSETAGKKKESRMPRGMSFYVMLAVALLAIWLFLQR
jgi:hypothetical protein